MDLETAVVLHLEDSDLDADLIRDRLERSGPPLALDRVSDRASFLNRITGRRYDLILSDYQVPSFEGLEALELAQEHQPGVPFIFVSGALGEELAVETLRRGATDYVLKERLVRLVPAVERAMAEARERAARRRAEGRALAILESMSEAFVILDADWRFAYVNAAFERMHDVRRAEILGTDHWQTYPATVGTRLEAEYRRVAAEGATVEFENYYEPWDRWFVVKAYPADGSGVCVQIREVTEAKRTAFDLRASEERLRVALAAGRMGTWSLDLATGRMECSDACRANYGRGPGEPFTYGDLAAAVLDEDRPGWRAAVAEAVERTADLAVEYRTRWPDGSVHWVHVRGSCATADGRAVGMSGVSLDITDRRRAEEDRERLMAELARREEELRLVTDAVPALISYLDADGVYRFANRAYEAWFGRPREQVVGRHLSEVLGEEAYETIRPGVERVLRGERHEFETFAAYRDGGGRHIHVNYVPRFEGERVVGFFALVTDITAAKRAEEALREADRRKDEFLATLAHELRNPLAPIRNALQVVKLSGERAVRERAWGTMERQLVQMVRLVDDLLDVSRITRGKLDLRKERIEAAAVVTQAIETARPHVEAAGHDLSVELSPVPIHLYGDPVRLAQVFANLLNNAAKYTEVGGRIWLAVERQGSDVVVSVRDTGIGIAADMLPRVFDLFTQVDAAREKAQGGLGIGLTLVKRLIEMHGGSVEARSDGVGRGSVFVVRLPVLLGHHAPAAPPREGSVAAPPRRSVLVVDDNRDGAESLAEMLRIMGNEVRTAHDGLEAVRSAEEFRPDVVLLDIGLPKLNGHDAARRIRAEPWGRRMVIVAVTGWGQDEDKRQSLEAGCNFHMVKPVNPAELERLLAGLAPVPV